MNYISSKLMDESGQSLVEYGLIVSLIAVAVAASLLLLGPKVANLYDIEFPSTT